MELGACNLEFTNIMCGIAGFLNTEKIQDQKKSLDSMLDSIKHRGPDGEGSYMGESFSIGMKRLAIIDVNKGRQPIFSQDKSLCIILNGEIYNYPELWQKLKILGYKFNTDHSDTEAVLHGYEEWGEKVVDHLIGMYAFVIYDLKKQQLFIARDRLGIKPFYYYEKDNQFVFSSEIKAILTQSFIKARSNQRILYEFLMYRVHDSKEETFFSDIKRLLPGHYMIVDRKGIKKIQRYWLPKFNRSFVSTKSDETYASEFYQLFKKVIKRHLLSDVSVGVSLSGGLDSSGVTSLTSALMKEGSDLHLGGKLHTFSALYPDQTIDESQYIHEVEKYTGSQPHYAYPKVNEFWDDFNQWVYFQEEPTISSAPYAYYRVYQLASKFVKVMLSGNGGDELWAGYLPYFWSYMTSAIDQGKYFSAAKEVILGIDLYSRYFFELLERKNPLIKNLNMKDFLKPDYFHKNKALIYKVSRNLNERLTQDVTLYSTPNLLRYEDKNSMAFSIESRVPFLDHELVEFIFNLPIDQKIKNGWTRYCYRNAMKGHLPDKNRLRRSKIGFTNPELQWLKTKAPEIKEIFNSKKTRSRQLYNIDNLINKFDKWVIGYPGDGLIFWRILITEMWMRRFID